MLRPTACGGGGGALAFRAGPARRPARQASLVGGSVPRSPRHGASHQGPALCLASWLTHRTWVPPLTSSTPQPTSPTGRFAEGTGWSLPPRACWWGVPRAAGGHVITRPNLTLDTLQVCGGIAAVAAKCMEVKGCEAFT